MSENIKVYQLTKHIPVYVNSKDSNVNFNRVLRSVRNIIPEYMFDDTLQEIMIGDFPGLKTKSIQSGYESGVIYLDKDLLNKSEDNIIKNIIHEIGHAIEIESGNILYNNQSIQTEFLDKRMSLFDALEDEGYEPSIENFIKLDYNSDLDNYLMNEVGYDTVYKLSKDYMIDPYAFTDLHEYIIMNFEKYVMGDVGSVKSKSGTLYSYLKDMLRG